jgi:hypothetical protein
MGRPGRYTGRNRGAPLKRASASGVGCAALFFFPFIAFGGAALILAVRRFGEGKETDALGLGAFGLVFAGVGVGGLIAVRAGARIARRREEQETLHPGEPWLWREDWAAGRVLDSNRSAAAGLWGFALLWNLIALPAAFFGIRETLARDNPAGWLVLLFPAVGMGLVFAAFRATLRSRKFAASRLDLVTVPAVIGYGLAGVIRTPADIRPSEGFALLLSCVRVRRTGSGKNFSTTETVLWQEEKRAAGQRGAGGPADGLVTNVPAAFHIPADALPCNESNHDDRVIWRLRAAASVPGVDYESVFEVPVFRTAASDQPPTEQLERLLGRTQSPDAWRQPADSPIRLTTSGGRTTVVFPGGRNRGVAVGLTIWTLAWMGVIVALFILDAPLVFKVVFGLFGLLFGYIALRLWFRVVEVTASPDELVVAQGMGAPRTSRTMPAPDVKDIVLKIGMQSGDRVWYDLYAVRANGRKLGAGGGIRDKREAEWIAAQLRRALGLA